MLCRENGLLYNFFDEFYTLLLVMVEKCVILHAWETKAGRLTLFAGGATLQTKERRAMSMYVTDSDLVQIGIFIVALIGLCHQIFKGKRK